MEINCTNITTKHAEMPSLVPDSKIMKRFSPIHRQIFTTAGSIICTISGGMVVGYSAILLPQLDDSKEFNFSSDDQSWIAAMAALAMTPGCILSAIIMETLGRKIANLIVNIPFVIGWLLICFSNGLSMFICGRLFQGISLGMSGPLISVYIGETTDPRHRGYLLGCVSLGYTLGIFITHLIGTFLTWRTAAIICGSSNILSFFIYICTPESPSYLLSKNKTELAYKSFSWLRGYGEESVAEFQDMILNQKLKNESSSKNNMISNMQKPEFYKPLFILIAMFFVLQFVGVNAVIFYTVTIMRDTVGNAFDEYGAMILIDSVRFLTTLLACILIRHIKRRPLFLLSGYGTGICMILLAIFLYISTKYIVAHYSFIPIALLIGYIFFSSLGLMPLPWCLIGELFPIASRGMGSGIASACNFIFFFVVVKIAPLIFEQLKPEGTFLFYGLISILGTFSLSLCLPETKNKTLQQIENEFSNRKIRNGLSST